MKERKKAVTAETVTAVTCVKQSNMYSLKFSDISIIQSAILPEVVVW